MKFFLYGPAVLRLALAAVFAAHGAQKLFGVWGGGGLHETTAMIASLGLDRIPGRALGAVGADSSGAAFSVAVLAGVVELGGGALLALGLWTRVASAALAMEMLVAAYVVHLPNGFFMNWSLAPGIGHGVEMNLVLVGGLVCLLFTGGGALSIDGWRAAWAEEAAAGRARLRSKARQH